MRHSLDISCVFAYCQDVVASKTDCMDTIEAPFVPAGIDEDSQKLTKGPIHVAHAHTHTIATTTPSIS